MVERRRKVAVHSSPASQFLTQVRHAGDRLRRLHATMIAEGYEYDGMDGYYHKEETDLGTDDSR